MAGFISLQKYASLTVGYLTYDVGYGHDKRPLQYGLNNQGSESNLDFRNVDPRLLKHGGHNRCSRSTTFLVTTDSVLENVHCNQYKHACASLLS